MKKALFLFVVFNTLIASATESLLCHAVVNPLVSQYTTYAKLLHKRLSDRRLDQSQLNYRLASDQFLDHLAGLNLEPRQIYSLIKDIESGITNKILENLASMDIGDGASSTTDTNKGQADTLKRLELEKLKTTVALIRSLGHQAVVLDRVEYSGRLESWSSGRTVIVDRNFVRPAILVIPAGVKDVTKYLLQKEVIMVSPSASEGQNHLWKAAQIRFVGLWRLISQLPAPSHETLVKELLSSTEKERAKKVERIMKAGERDNSDETIH